MLVVPDALRWAASCEPEPQAVTSVAAAIAAAARGISDVDLDILDMAQVVARGWLHECNTPAMLGEFLFVGTRNSPRVRSADRTGRSRL